MVGLVLVSHSRILVEALVKLVEQVAVEKIPPIAVAGGVGPDRQEFGTDAAEIAEAIQSIFASDGVVVLVDLGSAVLSAEMAVEFLPEAMRPAIRLCAAPLVEGAIAAGVQASLGSDLDAVCREAEQALLVKTQQFSTEMQDPSAVDHDQPETRAPQENQEIILVLKNKMGLHARPAARFVQRASSFKADIQVRNLTSGKGPVSGRSLVGVISLGAEEGDQIGISAVGRDAGAAVQALASFILNQL